jgi:hypothetical protein
MVKRFNLLHSMEVCPKNVHLYRIYQNSYCVECKSKTVHSLVSDDVSGATVSNVDL